MYMVVSPAKKLDFETPAPIDESSTIAFPDRSMSLIQHLRKLTSSEVSKLMKLSDSLSKLNVERYKNYRATFDHKNSKQALFAFNGDTYKGLDAYSLKKADINFAQKHLGILSGLYGLLRPLDLIQAYRLEMGTKLKVNQAKDLYEYWQDHVTGYINEFLQKEKLLVNLSSQEYFNVVDKKKIKGQILHPIFKEKKGNEYKVVGICAKRARGSMARFVIENRLKSREELKDFNKDGYKFNKKMSNDSEFVFTRS